MKINFNPKLKTTKDSTNWLTEPPHNNSLPCQAYFCESCLVVQAVPSKHCKLCEGCCQKFDHHCLFINKCVGLKNHRMFMMFVLATFISTTYYLYKVFYYLSEFSDTLDEKQKLLEPEQQGSFFYYALASDTIIWLIVLFIIDAMSALMVSTLLYFQIKFLSLGFTQQFQQPLLFVKTSKRMTSMRDGLAHRLDNLHIFLFGSNDDNEALYYRQLKEYNQVASLNKVIPLDDYPRSSDNQFLSNYPMATTMMMPSIGNVSGAGSNNI